jgi:hypothetical protein
MPEMAARFPSLRRSPGENQTTARGFARGSDFTITYFKGKICRNIFVAFAITIMGGLRLLALLIEGDSHHGNYGFAYEEWNFNPAMQGEDGFQYGWIEGFKSNGVQCGIVHEVALYVRRNGENIFVGKMECEKINNGTALGYPPGFIADANAARVVVLRNRLNPFSHAPITLQGQNWVVPPIRQAAMRNGTHPAQYIQSSKPNMRFKLNDWRPCRTLPALPFRYPRYRALLVQGAARIGYWNNLP